MSKVYLHVLNLKQHSFLHYYIIIRISRPHNSLQHSLPCLALNRSSLKSGRGAGDLCGGVSFLSRIRHGMKALSID